jgi:plasmid stabilization system protein ParE
MELTIFWTEFSEKELESIFKYYKRKANVTVAKKIVGGIYEETLKLKQQPRIGQIEELLKQRKQEFRYLVYKNYKIIYWINKSENRIEINDVFDTRQNPSKMKRTK